MTPYEGLTWQSVDLKGRFHGPFTTPTADGRLLVKQLQMPGGSQLAALDANLTANAGLVTLRAALDGLVIPVHNQACSRTQDCRWKLGAPGRPQRPVSSPQTSLLTLKANAITAGEQNAQLNLSLPDLAPFAALAGQKIRGDADIKAQVKHDDPQTAVDEPDADARKHRRWSAAWAGLVRAAPRGCSWLPS